MKNHGLSVFVVLRWVARVVGSLLALSLIFMLLSYTYGPEKSVPGIPMIVVLFLFAVGVGLAWFREALGGLTILASSVLFFVLNPHIIWSPGIYHVMPLVAFLLLLCSFRPRYMEKGQLEDR